MPRLVSLPDPERPGEEPERQLLVLKLLPNFISILAVCAGITALRFAASGSISMAVLLIVFAALLDGLDGRIARALGSESAIGAELDSLGDFVNFGVVPSLVLYFWGLRGEVSFGWIAVLILAVCCMLRLARFNVGARQAEPAEKTTFTGVPSPAGALLALLPIYVANATGWRPPEEAVALWMVVVGAMMISRLRTPSLKGMTVAASSAPFLLVGAAAAVAAVIIYPWVTLLLLSSAYLAALVWVALRHLLPGR